MRTNSDPAPEDALLDAALGDESWRTANTTFKVEALKAFRTGQRVRRIKRWAGSGVALAAVMVGVVHWVGRPALAPRRILMAQPRRPEAPQQPRQMTDAELIAAFPKGSCFIAEVDGKKELVFINPEVERIYVARAGVGAE